MKTAATSLGWLVAGVACALVAPEAVGQTAPAVPSAGRIQQDIRSEPQPAPRGISIDSPRFAEQIPAGAAEARFMLRGVELGGNHVLSWDQLSPAWSDRIGQTISLQQAFGIAAAISARYRQAGYILSQALLPQQELPVEGAILKVEIIEGYVARAGITGIDSTGGALRGYLDRITSERPLRLQTLERNLLLMNELAGLYVRANLSSSATIGAADLELALGRAGQGYSVSVHNRTSEALGAVRAEASADFRSGLGEFDRHTFRVISSLNDRLLYGGYAGELPLGATGAKLNWSASLSKAKPRTDIPFHLDSKSRTLSLGVSHAILRSRAMNLEMRLTAGASNNSARVPDETRDRIRSVRAGLTWDLAGAGGVNILDIEYARGMGMAGASRPGDPLLSRGGLAQPEFSKGTLYLARLQSLGRGFSLLLAGTSQFSGDVLVTSEQFGLGGDLFLRSYDPSELVGDYGVAGKAELRLDMRFGAWATTAYVFHDVGEVGYRISGFPKQSATSSGIGARFNAPRRLHGYLEASVPGRRPAQGTGDKGLRLFGGAGIDF